MRSMRLRPHVDIEPWQAKRKGWLHRRQQVADAIQHTRQQLLTTPLDRKAKSVKRLYLTPGLAAGPHLRPTGPKPPAHALQRVGVTLRNDGDRIRPTRVVLTELDPHVGLQFVCDVLSEDIELAGGFHGALEFTTHKRDVDVALSVYELDTAGRHLEFGYWLQRVSHNVDPREPEKAIKARGIGQRRIHMPDQICKSTAPPARYRCRTFAGYQCNA